MNNEQLKQIANSDIGIGLVTHLEEIADRIADIRYGDYPTDSRQIAIGILDELLTLPLKRLRDEGRTLKGNESMR